MNISASYYSEIGGRDKNEDAVSMLDTNHTVLALVADGLGGHSSGEIASAMAVKSMNGSLASQRISVVTMRNAVEAANHEVWKRHESNGMKTTISALWFDDYAALAANVGDTRIYQFRSGKLIYQSRDHSVAQMAVNAGDLRPEDVRTSRERHKLTRALGACEEVSVDIAHLDLQKGDALLLCSDGFWEKIQETEIVYDLAGAESAGNWMEKMRSRLKERGAETGDNHSAVAMIIK